MSIAVLYPRYDHPAIEERYASWQTQTLLKRGEELGPILYYSQDETAAAAMEDVETEHVLTIVDPLLLPSPRIGMRLLAALAESGAVAVAPVSNASENQAQFRAPRSIYLTFRELQETIEEMASEPREIRSVVWDASNPGAYLCRASLLSGVKAPLRAALAGREIGIVTNEYVHRWSSLRGQIRYDLLDRIDPQAKSILEFGCGEAPLGAALKKRQKCRVVGIELDPQAAAIAEKRIDAVYRGDVREIVELIHERFEWIVGGDIVEHLDEPWSFLAELRRLATPGGRLLLSLPNLANASVIGDLLHGRFDYAYMGLTCVGHLRFFTKESIADLLTIAGWTVEAITPQELASTPAQDALLAALDAAGYPYSKEDVRPTGYYVIARND